MLDIGITYESDIAHAMQIMREEIMKYADYFDNRTEADKQAGAPPVVIRVPGTGGFRGRHPCAALGARQRHGVCHAQRFAEIHQGAL